MSRASTGRESHGEDHQDQPRGHLEAVFKLLPCGDGRGRAEARILRRPSGADVDGKGLPPDDFDAQAKMVMANLTKALAAGGAKIADVTKITIYICNPHDVPKARGILQTYFAGQPPASTLCILRGLANPNFLLEIEAIAAV